MKLSKLFKKSKSIHKRLLPNGTDEVVRIGDITVPPDFINHPPKQYKIDKAELYYHTNKTIDKPISVLVETNERNHPNELILFDEYTRYLVLKKNNYTHVPVKYI